MKRVPPSKQLDESLKRLLEEGVAGEGSVVTELLQLGAKRFVQELVEREVAGFLGREHYEHGEGSEGRRGYRNGYRTRELATAEGAIAVEIPQVRGTDTPFHSVLVDFLGRNTEVLERLVAEMYARGLSTRDIEDAFTDATGKRLITRTEASAVTEVLWEEFQAFRERSLEPFPIQYLFLDAIYEPLRRQGRTREGILCAWGVLTDGRKVLLDMALGNKESYANWLDLLRGMVKRGLGVPLTITSDGAPGLLRAIEEVWPLSIRIRCWAHKTRNVLDKVPDAARDEVRAFLMAIRQAATVDAGWQAVERFKEAFSKVYPSATQCLLDDIEASLNHLRLPAGHRKTVRTTNLIERSFVEERRRTKTLPRFFNEKSGLKLVFATLTRAARRWQRVRITEDELKAIMALRVQLGIDPDPSNGQSAEKGGEKKTYAA